MNPYKYLLLDADNTLFDFNLGEKTAFFSVFSSLGLPVDDRIYDCYHEINDALWKQLERGEVSREALKVLRFAKLLGVLSIPDDGLSLSISRTYFLELSKQRCLLDGALEVCRALSKRYALYIITNGNTVIQRSRFFGSGLEPFIQDVFISEEIGVSKPSKAYFRHVMNAIGAENPADYLVIGDSLSSDIEGAAQSGIDAVWLDRRGDGDAQGREIMYIIKDIRELLPLLLKD